MFKKPQSKKRRKTVPWGDNILKGRRGRFVAMPMHLVNRPEKKANGRRRPRAR